MTAEDLARPHHRVAASTVAVVAANTVVAALGALALHVMTHRLGASTYGELVSVLAFISATLLFADLGINTYSGREIAKRKNDAADILGQNLGLRLVMSAILMPTVLGLALLFPHSNSVRTAGIAITVLTIPCEAIRAVSMSYYVATIQNYKTAIITLLTQVIYISGAITAIDLGYGIVGCFVAYDIAMIATAAIAFIAVRRSVPFLPRFSVSLWRGILGQSLGIGAIQIVNVLYLRMNALMLTAMTTYHTVGQYGVAAAIVTYLLVVPNAFMLSMMPLLVASPIDRLTGIVNRACIFMAIAGVLAVTGTICLAHDVISVIAGPDFEAATPILQILSISVLFTCLTSVFTYSSFSRDRHRRLLLVSASGLVSNILLDFILIPTYGARGVAAATVLVEFFILVGTYVMFRNRVGDHFSAWWPVGRVLFAGIVTLLVGHITIDAVFSPGLEQLVFGVAFIPALLGGLLISLRCLPIKGSFSGFVRDALKSRGT